MEKTESELRKGWGATAPARSNWCFSLALALAVCFWAAQHSHLLAGGEKIYPEQIYQRATNEFLNAILLKPAEQRTNDLIFTLAPLIIQEQLLPSAPSTLNFQPSTVYAIPDTVQLNGKPHARLTYLWRYASGPADSGLPVQGIRITLDTSGQPVIWEVLADTTGAALVFVAQSLETVAKAQFGQPLPGRRYSIERSLAEAREVIVPRILDDGPVPMGPIVYLSAGTRDVSTLICRCMPAQAKKLLATSTYALVPASDSFLQQSKQIVRHPTAFWPGDPKTETRIEKFLRLPPGFYTDSQK